MSPSRNEQGFILVGAIWLLVLCGSIAAILMLRSMSASARAAAEGGEFRNELALESAVETVLASLLLDGRRSPWSVMPADGTLNIDGENIAVSVTSESGRIDVNEVDLQKLALTLQGLGLTARERQAIVGAVAERRARKESFLLHGDLRSLFAKLGRSDCIEEDFTVFSGLSAPDPSQLSPRLAAAMGEAKSTLPGGGAAALTPGAAFRLKVRIGAQTPSVVVARVTGLQDDPVTIYRWEKDFRCG